MPSMESLEQDVVRVDLGPQQAYTLSRPLLRSLLHKEEPRIERVPLARAGGDEIGDVRLSKSNRSIIVRTLDPDRSLLASVREARAFIEGTIPSLLLHESRDEDAEGEAATAARQERIADAKVRLHELARNAQARMAARGPGPRRKT